MALLYRVLSKLLLLDGERLSYRTLAVEQIGSVYEAIMGFELQVASGKSIAIKPAKKHGAPATINLEELLRRRADKRLKWFTETTDQKLTGQAADGLKSCATIEELLVALDRKIAKTVTPNVVPPGSDDLPAVKRTAEEWVALHAQFADWADCRSGACAGAEAAWRESDAGADSES